jgi:ABC-type glycerol-3-phosphate transport system substrate-binding protein
MKIIIQEFIAKFYQLIILILLAIILVLSIFGGIQTWRASYYKTLNENAEVKCNTEKAKIHAEYKEQADKEAKAYQEALAKQQTTINKLSSDYETEKAKYKVKVETVTQYVDKIIERDVYRNVCIDDDGMQSINSLIKSRGAS